MMVMGGLRARRPLRHRAEPRTDPANPTLENSAGDVKYETDFRPVYAQVLDNWLGSTRCRSSAPTSAPARRRSV